MLCAYIGYSFCLYSLFTFNKYSLGTNARLMYIACEQMLLAVRVTSMDKGQ